jgi:hypothetical protein
MKLTTLQKNAAFTLSEITLGLTISSVVIAAALTSGIALQRSFRAVDTYLATQMQQVRIIDYLGRDVKRALIVTTSADLQSVTVTVPKYIIQAGDPEAIGHPELIGTPRTPQITYTSSGLQPNYGASSNTVVYSITGQSIVRIENGVVTTIASSTDQLVPKTTDVELANTEYSKTSVTFMPLFTIAGSQAERLGTSVYSTAYLRNRRRG